MIKRAILALTLMIAATVAQAAGTIGYSLSQQLDTTGKPLNGCLLYTIQAGTTSTPQNSYKDTALTLPQPNPMVCDAAGRLPQFFLADGQIKVRLTDRLGVVQVVADNILVIGPSSGGGGGGTVDPTTISATGDVKVAYGTQVITGWVRVNGRTIGSATSGATERANADTQALFQYLWTADANLAVSGGRGVSSIADWTANKAITLPDGRGRVMAGLDDMGNSAAGRLTAAYFGATGGCSGALGTTLGAACGQQSHTLTAAQIPTLSGTTNGANTTTSFSYPGTAGTNGGGTVFSYIAQGAIQANRSNTFIVDVTTPIPSLTANINTAGSGNAHPTIMPTMLITTYIKL
jgi:microcystin-dependent protein